MMNDFPTFEEIEDHALRTWNRVNMLFNIKQLVNNEIATEYAKQFGKKDVVAIYVMCNYIVAHGYEHTRREIFKDLNA